MLNPASELCQDHDFLMITIRVPHACASKFDMYFEEVDFKSAKPLVEEIGASEASEEGSVDEDEEFDWEIEQTPYEEVSESALRSQCHYGFGNLRAGVFQWLPDELSEIIDIKDPDFTSVIERRQKRLAAELAKFDADHYLADFFEDDAVEQILKYSSWWNDGLFGKEPRARG
ncbi:SHQ1-like [Sigmodon hispidus]